MRKNAPRKWLHAILDLLPVILIPVFMIYSHRHTIDSGSIVVAQNEVVDFNQRIINGNFADTSNYFLDNDVEVEILSNQAEVELTINIDPTETTNFGINMFMGDYSIIDHIYLFQYTAYGESAIDGLSVLFGKNGGSVNWFNTSAEIPLTTTKTTYYKIGTCKRSENFVCFGIYPPVQNYTYYLSNLMLFDLTQMFGSGNEPTIAEFNQFYSADYYDYVLSRKELIKGVSTITFDDTDIMSQSMYQLYNSVDKYFNMNNIFNMNAVYDWFVLNVFNGNAPIVMYVVWNIALYELVMDLMFLLYALFMWFVDWCKSLIERTYDVGRGK